MQVLQVLLCRKPDKGMAAIAPSRYMNRLADIDAELVSEILACHLAAEALLDIASKLNGLAAQKKGFGILKVVAKFGNSSLYIGTEMSELHIAGTSRWRKQVCRCG